MSTPGYGPYDTAEDYLDEHGWHYRGEPEPDKDCRHLVTLEEDGMTWIGLRAWHAQDKRWYNGGEPERAKVKAWMVLPPIAYRYWHRAHLLPARKRASVQQGGSHG